MVALALGDLSDGTPLSASARHRGTVRLVTERLRELGRWGIGPEAMRALADKVGPSCGAKLLAMAEIADLVADSMDVSRRESATDYISRCLALGRTNGISMPSLVAFLGDQDHPWAERWFVWAADQGCDVDLVVEHDPQRDGAFAVAERASERLSAPIEPLGSPDLWTSRLFGGEPGRADPPIVTIMSAGDPLAEAEWVLRRCLELRRGGAPWSAMGIYARETEVYTPMLIAASARLGAPVIAPRAVPLLSNGFARLTLQVLKALTEPGIGAFARLARNPYFESSRPFCESLWDAACRIGGKDPDPWTGLGEWLKERADEAPWAPAMLAWRADAISRQRRFTEWLSLFRSLVGDTTLVDSVARRGAVARERDLLAQTVLQRSLADHAFVHDQSGRADLSLKAFVHHCEAIWSDETVQVPAEGDGIRVAASGLTFGPHDAVFALGMLEGSLPRRRREDPLFTDDDRAEISAAWGVRMLDSTDLAKQERDEFVRVCLAATKELTFSYPQSTGDSDSVPAFYLQDLEDTLNGRVRTVARSRVIFAPPVEDCVADADRRLRAALDEGGHRHERPVLSQADNLARIRLNEGDIRLREVASALVCQFQAAARYRLGLRGEPLEDGPWILSSAPVAGALASAPDPDAALAALWDAFDRLVDDRRIRHDEYSSTLLRRAADRAFRHWVDVEFAGRGSLARDPGSVRYQVPLKELGMTKFEGTVPVVSRINGVPMLEWYTTDHARFRLEEEPPDPRLFMFAVWLLALTEGRQSSFGALLSPSSGDRELLLFGASVKDFPKPKGTKVVGKTAAWEDLAKRTRRRLKEVIGSLQSSVMEARPGGHCRTCSFGELCRSSEDYGDRFDAFS
jgi:hypothetical protein